MLYVIVDLSPYGYRWISPSTLTMERLTLKEKHRLFMIITDHSPSHSSFHWLRPTYSITTTHDIHHFHSKLKDTFPEVLPIIDPLPPTELPIGHWPDCLHGFCTAQWVFVLVFPLSLFCFHMCGTKLTIQVWCCWQVKLCDPHLSALEARFSRRGAIQTHHLYFLPLYSQFWSHVNETNFDLI